MSVDMNKKTPTKYNDDTRPAIPREIERQVLMEAGFRCAIRRCMQPNPELAHIVPWNESHDSSYDNLIALCPNHHAEYDRGKPIDRKAIRNIKRNLAITNWRYGDL